MHTIRDMIALEENCALKAYPDPLTHSDPWTIGWGHTGPEVKEGLIWTQEQADQAREHDLAAAEALCRHNLPWFDEADPVRQAVLIGMAYQMGGRLLGFHDTLAAVRDQHYAHAAGCMLASLWAKQTPKRATRMARQMETGEWQY